MARFLLSAMPFTGHVTPVLAIAEALVARGHDVRFYTGSAFGAEVEAAGARFVPWAVAPDFDEQNLAATFPRLVGKRGMAQLLINMTDCFIGTAAAQVRDLDAEWGREPWDAQAADETSLGIRLFAERTGVRSATVMVLPLYLASTQGPPGGAGLAPGRTPVTRARDAVLRAVLPLAGRPLVGPIDAQRTAVGLRALRQPFDRATLSPDLVLASGVPALDFGRTDRPPQLHFVGLLRSARPPTGALPPWWDELDAAPRVVVVTQGTQNVEPTDLIRPALEALAGEDALVVALTGVRGRDEVPFPVPSNARVAGFVPFDALLPHARLVITNGGWGGTLRTLAAGVPLIVAGGDLDKPEVAARVAWSGAGLNLRGATPSALAVRRAVERVTRDDGFASAASRIAVDLAAAGGASRAADLLEAFA